MQRQNSSPFSILIKKWHFLDCKSLGIKAIFILCESERTLTLQIKRKKPEIGKSYQTQENWRARVSSNASTNHQHNTWRFGCYNRLFLGLSKRNEKKRVAGALLTDLTQSWGCLSSLNSADLCCLQNQVHNAYPTHGLINRLHRKNPISAEASASFRAHKIWVLNINLSLEIYCIPHGQKELSSKEDHSHVSQN